VNSKEPGASPAWARLGQSIDEEWLDAGRDEALFARLAERHLVRSVAAGAFALDDLFDWFFSPRPGVLQPADRAFGQPPITLYRGQGFHIEALFWMDGTTSIHQHGFSGAFTPIFGSSVHSTWRFEATRRIRSTFHLGRLERLRSEILRPGDVRPIRAGRDLIHQLFHLERPSVTVVVRTDGESEHLPQLHYIPPGLAMDRLADDPALRVVDRQIALLDVMMTTGVGDVERYAGQVMSRGDLVAAWRVLSCLIARGDDGHGLAPDAMGRLLTRARQRHGELVDVLHQAARHQRRIALLSQLRARLHDPEHRFFLALLMLQPDRDSILELIAAEYPDRDPGEQVVTWASELSGVAGADQVGVELDEANTAIFRSLLAGDDSDALLRRLADEYEPGDIAEQKPAILEQAARLARSEVFSPLFTASAFARHR